MYLNCHSVFSFRYGTLKVTDLLDLAQQNQQKAMVLTDINNTSACLNFIREAERRKIKPLVGVDFRNGNQQQFVAIAKNNQGFETLNRYLSEFLHFGKRVPSLAPEKKDVYFIYPFNNYKSSLISLGENQYIGISLSQLKQLPFSVWYEHQDKMVLLQTVSFQGKRDFNIHRLLRAIGNNCLLSKLAATEEGKIEDVMYQRSLIDESLKSFPKIRKNTAQILKEASITFTYKGKQRSGAVNNNRQTFTGSKEGDFKRIRELCQEGLAYRYPSSSKRELIKERLEKELKLIHEQGFESYFLINWDMLRFARENGFFYVGRGSGANSVVAYLLRITDVDPVKLDLYFERFINPYRENPPDFDIDFSWKDRDTVTDYLFKTYGEADQIALLATYNTFSYRSLLRELGKVFGLPKDEIDRLVEEKQQQRVPDEYVRLIYRYAKYMEGIPSHLSIHAGGILISEKPIYYFSATNLPPKGYQTVQFDMIHAEDAGLYKFDVLSQRGLGKVRDSVELVIERGKEPDLDIHQPERFFEDEKIKELLRHGNTIGCFYVESPAMRMLLKKLKADNYLGLVAASSIIRPGVAKSGMMREYILRSQAKNNSWQEKTPQVMQDLMKETYGVMVYQEDVIKVAHHFAKLDFGEADMLRRGMSGKFRSRDEFAKVRQKFFDNCKAEGYSKAITAEVWRQIESFAGYAFSKGHSASYAVESYQSLYLKAHYPAEFILGVLNNGGGFYSTEVYLHEARMLGFSIEEPCVNQSNELSVLVGEDTIYLGLKLVSSLEERILFAFLNERRERGVFRSLEDFINRCAISKEQLSLLIRCGAFRFSGKSKQELLWESHHLLGPLKKSKPNNQLFPIGGRKFELPELDVLDHEEAFDQMELFGFPLCSPFTLLQEEVDNTIKARNIKNYLGREVRIIGYLVAIKNTSTSRDEGMQFGTFLDIEGEWIDTVHFPPVSKRCPFKGKGCYFIEGKVVEEFNYFTIEVGNMKRMDYVSRI